jgi:hypothetical protein
LEGNGGRRVVDVGEDAQYSNSATCCAGSESRTLKGKGSYSEVTMDPYTFTR